jgi:hypothetical protein
MINKRIKKIQFRTEMTEWQGKKTNAEHATSNDGHVLIKSMCFSGGKMA